jgi:DNA polymerase III epsilon subunit family exonuclease
MPTSSMRAVRDALRRLRDRGESVAVGDLAQRLLLLEAPPSPSVARHVVGTALGCAAGSLPERLEPEQLRPAEDAAVASVPIAQADFAVVDLETTGLAVDGAAILEIGAVRVSRLAPVQRFATLVRPPARVPAAITALTGIDDAALVEAPPAHLALRAFRRWLDRTPHAPFVAHNAGFDAGFVERGLADHALPAYRAPVLCTRKLARRIVPGLGRYNLDHVCAHFGVANRARHRALGDAEATARVWVELLHLAREDLGVETLGDLLDLQERPAGLAG